MVHLIGIPAVFVAGVVVGWRFSARVVAKLEGQVEILRELLKKEMGKL